MGLPIMPSPINPICIERSFASKTELHTQLPSDCNKLPHKGRADRDAMGFALSLGFQLYLAGDINALGPRSARTRSHQVHNLINPIPEVVRLNETIDPQRAEAVSGARRLIRAAVHHSDVGCKAAAAKNSCKDVQHQADSIALVPTEGLDQPRCRLVGVISGNAVLVQGPG